MPHLIRAGGRIWRLEDKALRNYGREYGLDEVGEVFSLGECLEHITVEFEEALAKGKVTRPSKRMLRWQAPSLVISTIGSKIVNIRISLKYNTRQAHGEDDGVAEDVLVES